MKLPYLKKKPEIKSCHNFEWQDDYSWIHQNNILEVLKDKSKLDPEVKKYLEEENNYTDHHLKDTKDIQKKLSSDEYTVYYNHSLSKTQLIIISQNEVNLIYTANISEVETLFSKLRKSTLNEAKNLLLDEIVKRNNFYI